jgi:hypothetical protein
MVSSGTREEPVGCPDAAVPEKPEDNHQLFL